MLKNIYSKFEKGYVNKVNNLFLSFGGINTTFQLETKKVTFATVKPFKYNFYFIFFNKVKDYKIFKVLFSILLRLPFFFMNTFFGSILMSLIIVWAAVGREPLTTFCCFNLMIDFWFFWDYFLRLEGLYQYCIDNYDFSFVEKYIDNPSRWSL